MSGRIVPDTSKTTAIELLADGRSVAQTAEVVGVDPATVGRWRHDPTFVEQLDQRRAELWEVEQVRLRSLVGLAIDVLGEDLRDNSNRRLRHDAAVQVLRSVGLYKVPTAKDPEPAWERLLAALSPD
jgi:hypothetical protein